MIKRVTSNSLNQLSENAQNAARHRAHLNVHEQLDSNVQRLFIATEPATYIRPHRHSQAHKWEFFTVIEGEMELLLFDDAGKITHRETMSPKSLRSVEIPPGVWHSYICKKSGTQALEIKEGAYIVSDISDFLPSSPADNSPEVEKYLEWMKTAEATKHT